MMKRRKFMCNCLCYSTGATFGTVTGALAKNSHSRFAGTCLSDTGQAMERFRLQAASSDSGDDDASPIINDNEETPPDWQGVAARDLIWRRQDVRLFSNGVIHLAIGFVYEPGDGFKDMVVSRANRWMASGNLKQKINFVFDRPIEECEIRVASSSSAGVDNVNLSKLGRRAKNERVPAEFDERRQSTMIIHDPEAVEHEFGHALGLGHEATHPTVIDQINMDKAISYFAQKPNKWTAKRTRNNFRPMSACRGDPRFNPASVMLYPLPAEITNFGVSLYSFSEIHKRDRKCVEDLYGV